MTERTRHWRLVRRDDLALSDIPVDRAKRLIDHVVALNERQGRTREQQMWLIGRIALTCTVMAGQPDPTPDSGGWYVRATLVARHGTETRRLYAHLEGGPFRLA
jgi:hypothetical protein